MDVLWFWAGWCAATLAWAMTLHRCEHAYSRVLVGYYGGRVWLACTAAGICWSGYRLLVA
jgi:hypothetical protein